MSFLLTIFGLALALLMAYGYLCRRLWRLGGIRRKVALVLVPAPMLTVAYEEYFARFPRESFYREKFKHIAGRELLASARFVLKDASYPDSHGDSGACALVELSQQDYEALLADARARRRDEDTTHIDDIDCPTKLERYLHGASYAAEVWTHRRDAESMHWALVAGRPLLVFGYCSW